MTIAETAMRGSRQGDNPANAHRNDRARLRDSRDVARGGRHPGERITKLPAPWDMPNEALKRGLPPKHACYIISPDERMVPSGMKAGEYCLAGQDPRDDPEDDPDTPVYVELKDGSSMLGLRLNPREREGQPMSLLRWGKADDDYDPALMDIPDNEITRELAVLAIYEGRPSARRPPSKRVPQAN